MCVFWFMLGCLALFLWFVAGSPFLYHALSRALTRVTLTLFRGTVDGMAMDFCYDIITVFISRVAVFTDVVFLVFASLAAALDRP